MATGAGRGPGLCLRRLCRRPRRADQSTAGPGLDALALRAVPPHASVAAAALACLAAGLVWALQVFSGHTQTVFISGIGLGLYALLHSASYGERQTLPARVLRALGLLAASFAAALLLALPQLLPSLEMMGTSRPQRRLQRPGSDRLSLPLSMLGRAFFAQLRRPNLRRIHQPYRHRRSRPGAVGFILLFGCPAKEVDLGASGGGGDSRLPSAATTALSAAGGVARLQFLSRARSLSGAVQPGDGAPGRHGCRSA